MKHKHHTLLLGAHMSIAGGLEKAIIQGESIGCTAIQIFTKSNRQWHAKPLGKENIELFKQTWRQSSIVQEVIAHASYLINIGTSDTTVHEKSANALATELIRCIELDIPYLVLHPGSRGGSSEQESLMRISETLNTLFDKVDGKTMILLEIMAGQGKSVCYNFEQLAYVYKHIHHKKRVGICFDTCHAFAAGYDFRDKLSYQKLWKDFDKHLGLDLLKAMHINDSKKAIGCRVDRHEEIGKGMLGLETFELLFNDNRFFDVPKILETPRDNINDFLKNMHIIEQLILPDNAKRLDIKIKKKSKVIDKA